MYVNEIRLHEQYEYSYAKQNNKVGFHQRKWENISTNPEANQNITSHVIFT